MYFSRLTDRSQEDRRHSPRVRRRVAAGLGIFAGAAMTLLSSGCGGGSSNTSVPILAPAAARYRQVNIVSDTPGVAPDTDPRLVNPWGIAFSPTSPFWIANNHSGTSTVYNGNGTIPPIIVSIPAPGGGEGAPSGTVFNGVSTDFLIAANGVAATFLFDTEDGTIAAWNVQAGLNAVIVADRSGSGAVYKGLALAHASTGNVLFATDFHNGVIDKFDSQFRYLGSFTDTNVPAGFAPFNIQTINGNLFVTFAKQLAPDNHDDEAGPGNGFVDIFSPEGTLIKRLVSHGRLNSPWGLTVAPANFGQFSGALLVGNFGDGTINAYNVSSGAYLGTLAKEDGTTLDIPGLWALTFGNGVSGANPNFLYFTAGPGGEAHGLFGSLQVPS